MSGAPGFLALLAARVTRLAEGLERTGPEPRLIAPVRVDVVAYAGRARDAFGQAVSAERVGGELHRPQPLPALGLVPGAVRLDRITLPIIGASGDRLRQLRSGAMDWRRERQASAFPALADMEQLVDGLHVAVISTQVRMEP